MKKLLLILAFALMAVGVGAQELIVKSPLQADPSDIYARNHVRTAPNTGEAGAVIKVAIPSKKVSFSSSWILGDVYTRAGEYIVHVAKGTKKITVVVEGCLPYELNFADHGVEAAQSKTTYKIRLQLPDKERTRALIMPQYSIGKDQGSYGLMVGFVKKHGAFLRAKSDFNFISTSAACAEDGLIDGRMPWYTGKSEKKRWAITAGYVARVAKPLYVYGGLGYGERVLAWERQDGSLVEYENASYKGLEAEVGLIARFGIFALSAGVQTNSFKYMEFNVGVGVLF